MHSGYTPKSCSVDIRLFLHFAICFLPRPTRISQTQRLSEDNLLGDVPHTSRPQRRLDDDDDDKSLPPLGGRRLKSLERRTRKAVVGMARQTHDQSTRRRALPCKAENEEGGGVVSRRPPKHCEDSTEALGGEGEEAEAKPIVRQSTTFRNDLTWTGAGAGIGH